MIKLLCIFGWNSSYDFRWDSCRNHIGRYILRHHCTGCNDYAIPNGNTGQNCYICSQPNILPNVNRSRMQICSFTGNVAVIQCRQYGIMSNQCTIVNVNTALVLKFAAAVEKYIFAYMKVLSAVCVKRWKHRKTLVHR